MNCAEFWNIVLSILSFLLAFISVGTVIITLQQNKAILEQNNKMLEEQTRPILVVYPVIDTATRNEEVIPGYIIIRNCGMSQGIIKHIESNIDLRGKYFVPNDKDFLKMAVGSVLAPGQNIHCLIDESKIEGPLTITIEYESPVGKKYKESTPIDFNSGIVMPEVNHTKLKLDDDKKVGKELEIIRGIMEDIQHRKF